MINTKITGGEFMFGDMTTIDVIKLLAPLIIIQYGLAIYCAVDISRKGVRNLSKFAWIAIVLFVNMLGPISYLLFGRKRWQDD